MHGSVRGCRKLDLCERGASDRAVPGGEPDEREQAVQGDLELRPSRPVTVNLVAPMSVSSLLGTASVNPVRCTQLRIAMTKATA